VPFLDPAAEMAAIPNDPFFDRQWGFHNTGTNPGIPTPREDADVNAPEAWDLAQGSPSVVVAIIDSGLRLGHPDIATRVWTNAGETANGLDDDGNGLVDDVRGWDWVNDDNDPTDDSGHGSNIAGLVGAIRDNELGYAGLDQGARLMILKGFRADLAYFYSWAIPAVTYAVDEGAHVVNFSAGGSEFSAAFEAAAEYAYGMDVLFTAPMMNANSAVVYYPAAFPHVVAVGATNARDERAAPFCWGGGSNYGPHIDLTAPGDRIYNITSSSDTNYNVYWCGSSMSAPTVAATASLMLSLDPTLTPDAILAVLRATAEDQVGRPTEDTPGFDDHHGYGRLDAFAALSALATAAEDDAADQGLSLSAAPNPAAGSVRLALVLERTADVSVGVYDVLGREVATLHDGPLAAGPHAFVLDAARLPAGVYVVRARTASGVAVQRLTVGH
jgi:subtilisin family serine protease